MLTELEFAREKYRQFLLMMPFLVEDAKKSATSQQEYERMIDLNLDRILQMRRTIRRLEKN